MTRYTFPTAVIAIFITVSACGAIAPPPPGEFGPGPRTSAHGLYVVTLLDATELKARRMYTLPVTVVDGKSGEPVQNATIAIAGGMPQHGHGLPTRPRITKSQTGDRYELGGLRFNMGGWWKLELTITTPAGTDTVIFNLQI